MHRSYQEINRQLPPEYDEGINMHGACLDHTFVVLDDDPTGCQTVHDVPVLFSWEVKTLVSYFDLKVRMIFLLVNTRSMPGKKAVHTIREAMKNLQLASRITGRNFIVISRSDSTLRGHYPEEVEAIAVHLDDGS